MLKTYMTSSHDRVCDSQPTQLKRGFASYPTKVRTGFTLFEMAVVLTIIGLVTGVIMTGQTLIRAAELSSVINEYHGYQNAVAQFRVKYMNLPGDMPNARAVWGDAGIGCTNALGPVFRDGTCDGDGNRVILTAGSLAKRTSEAARAWQHLSLAGLIDGTYTGMLGAFPSSLTNSYNVGLSVPASSIKPAGWGIAYTDLTDYVNADFFYRRDYRDYMIFSGVDATYGQFGTAVLSVADAFNIDHKLDDGKPATGTVIAFGKITTCTTSIDVFDFTTGEYRMTSTVKKACSLFFAR